MLKVYKGGKWAPPLSCDNRPMACWKVSCIAPIAKANAVWHKKGSIGDHYEWRRTKKHIVLESGRENMGYNIIQKKMKMWNYLGIILTWVLKRPIRFSYVIKYKLCIWPLWNLRGHMQVFPTSYPTPIPPPQPEKEESTKQKKWSKQNKAKNQKKVRKQN